jgi:hypothetical protein
MPWKLYGRSGGVLHRFFSSAVPKGKNSLYPLGRRIEAFREGPILSITYFYFHDGIHSCVSHETYKFDIN